MIALNTDIRVSVGQYFSRWHMSCINIVYRRRRGAAETKSWKRKKIVNLTVVEGPAPVLLSEYQDNFGNLDEGGNHVDFTEFVPTYSRRSDQCRHSGRRAVGRGGTGAGFPGGGRVATARRGPGGRH